MLPGVSLWRRPARQLRGRSSGRKLRQWRNSCLQCHHGSVPKYAERDQRSAHRERFPLVAEFPYRRHQRQYQRAIFHGRHQQSSRWIVRRDHRYARTTNSSRSLLGSCCAGALPVLSPSPGALITCIDHARCVLGAGDLHSHRMPEMRASPCPRAARVPAPAVRTSFAPLQYADDSPG